MHEFMGIINGWAESIIGWEGDMKEINRWHGEEDEAWSQIIVLWYATNEVHVEKESIHVQKCPS